MKKALITGGREGGIAVYRDGNWFIRRSSDAKNDSDSWEGWLRIFLCLRTMMGMGR